MLASVCKNTITSVIVSGFGMSPSAGYQFGLVTGPPFPQSVLHFCSFISFRQGEFWDRVFDCGMEMPFFHLMPCILLEVDSTSSLSPLLRISSKVPPSESWVSFIFHVSGTFWRVSTLLSSVDSNLCILWFYGLYQLFSEYIPCMCFWVWVTSLRMILICSIHLPAKLRMSLFLIAE